MKIVYAKYLIVANQCTYEIVFREATMTLHQACEEGNIENVKKMLTALGSQNQKENLADCLQVAVENGKRYK